MILLASGSESIRRRWRESLADAREIFLEAVSLDEVREQASRQGPALVLLHQTLPGFGGAGDLAALLQTYPGVKWMIFSDRPDLGDQGLGLLHAGAVGFCNTYMAPDLLVKAVELVKAGEVWVGRRLTERLIREIALSRREQGAAAERVKLEGLTQREQEIAQLVAEGASNKRIASQLDISERTVKAHLTTVFRKTGTGDRLRLALLINSLTEKNTSRD